MTDDFVANVLKQTAPFLQCLIFPFQQLPLACISSTIRGRVQTCRISAAIIHKKNDHRNQSCCLEARQARRCLSISFYLWPNIMLLGNSPLCQSYQINIKSSASGSNVYAKSHHFPRSDLMTHRETQRNVPG